MKAALEFRLNNSFFDEYELVSNDDVVTIGRETRNRIKVPSGNVSRQHAKIYTHKNQVVFEDHSSNGSFVQDQLVKNETVLLSYGDIIKIGDCEIIYKAHSNMNSSAHRTFIKDINQDSIHTEKYVLVDMNSQDITHIKKDYFTIGFGSENHIALPRHEENIGEYHCTLKVYKNNVYLESPHYDTIVNGATIGVDPFILTNGDVIEIGKHSYQFQKDSGELTKFNIVTRSPKIAHVIKQIDLCARADEPILILGETGSGKELVAQAIHKESSRKNKRFVAVNCGAIKDTIAESELFGHVQGAYTGADRKRDGYFKEADGGTLFLDELGELPPNVQVALLRAIETNQIRPVGSDKDFRVNVRIIAATNRNLHDIDVRENYFRDDLYFRLNLLSIEIPPLRDRIEDIPLLMEHFANVTKVKYKNYYLI